MELLLPEAEEALLVGADLVQADLVEAGLLPLADRREHRLGIRAAGDTGDGPRYGQVRLCWAENEEQAKQTVFELWRHSGLSGTLNQELPRPSDFDAVAESVTLEMATAGVPCGPDPEPVLAAIRKWEQAGFDQICLHQVGADQEGFLRFWKQELEPKLG